ncbi:MAG: tripartite tricarboxylate transporter permease [Verrucomicrobiota bacterium]
MVETFTHFFHQLGGLLNPFNLVVLLAAVTMGIAFGALPGLTATLGIALLTTATATLDLPLEVTMIALMGVYVGAIYGGCHPAVLLNIPGTAAGAASAVEGYPLCKQGRGGEAIATATVTSFGGTVFGVLAMLLLAPMLTVLALKFQSSEKFLLAFFGVLICGSLTAPDMPLKGWIAGLLGVFLATVGIDPIHGYQRFTFDTTELVGGIKPIPVILGAFAVPQIIRAMMQPTKAGKPPVISRLWPQLKILKNNVWNAIRSGLLGVGVGSIPGVGEDIAAWLSYDTAKKVSKEPETFGKGSMKGLISAETANNACIGGALIPLLTLGVPGSPPAMMLLGALELNDVRTGPTLAMDRPEFIPQMAAILLWASFTMLVLGFLLSRVSVHVLRIPTAFLMPIVALFSVIGAYAFDNSLWDVGFMIAFGVAAYFMEETGYPVAPLVIGLILGPMAEENLRRALIDSGGSLAPFFTRPLSLVFLVLIAASVSAQFFFQRKRRLESVERGTSDSSEC